MSVPAAARSAVLATASRTRPERAAAARTPQTRSGSADPMTNNPTQLTVKTAALYLLLAVLGLGLLAIVWSSLDQLSSLPADHVVTTSTPVPPLDCTAPAPFAAPLAPSPSDPADQRWVFVQHGDTAGYVLTQPGPQRRPCPGHR